MRSKLTTIGAALLIATSAVLLTACNDKDTPVAAPTTSAVGAAGMGPGQTGDTGASTSPGGSNSQSTVKAIGKTGWYDGFDITVDKATVVPDGSGGARVTIDITYKNNTTDDKMISVTPTLQVGDQIDGGADFTDPTVPGKGSAAGTVTTSVKKLGDAGHLIDTLTLVYGPASANQTKIPLKADAKVDSIQPKTLPITGTLVQGHTTVQVTGATLTPSYTKDERGKMELALHVKLIGGGDISDGGANIFTEYFSIKTPDGQSLVADQRGFIDELLDRNQTIDNPKDLATFVVASPGTGAYVLSYDATKGQTPAATLAVTVN